MFKENQYNEDFNYAKFEARIPEQRKEIMAATQIVSQEINQSLGEKLLSSDGTTSRKAFNFSEEVLSKQKSYIEQKEEKFIRRQYNLDDNQVISQDLKIKWEKEQGNRKSELMEMAVMIILHKVLKDEYVVCRANKYDDYHGVDNIIVHKSTGTVLCAFDDVKTAGGVYEWKKEEYINEFGPQAITYGFTFDNGILIKKKIYDVPKFYLKFTPQEFYKMLDSINCKKLDQVSDDEYTIYEKIIDSLSSQLASFKDKHSDNKKLMSNIDKFEKLLPSLKNRKK